MKIVVASKNPVKANAILGAFEKLFPELTPELHSVAVGSGVSDQPMSDDETRTGALNRVRAAREAEPDAAIWAGLEGGIEDTPEGMRAFAWIVCETEDLVGQSRTATFPLPPKVASLVRGGTELGEADDIVFGKTDSKQKEGAIGILTHGLVDRASLYEHAAIMAFIPLRNSALFAGGA